MSIIRFDSDISEMAEYEPLPNGVYRATVIDVEERSNEKTPKGFLTTTLRVSPDDYPADYDANNAPDGVNVVMGYLALPDAENRRTVGPFKKFLMALGIAPKGSQFETSDMIGAETQVHLVRGEFQGALVNNIQGVSPVPQV